MRFIVTDLTRFRNPEIVCMAGIEPETGQCIRPMPYIKTEVSRNLNILPGAVLSGELLKPPSIVRPHVEDMNYSQELSCHDACSSEEFRAALEAGMYPSINEGFDNAIPPGDKVIPSDRHPSKSIISLKLNPSQVEIVRDGFNPEKIKLHLVDNDEREYRYLPITDLGFYNLAISKQEQPTYTEELNRFIEDQDEVYLRIGLSRSYDDKKGRAGYWIQVNGIYTFPNFMTEVRTY